MPCTVGLLPSGCPVLLWSANCFHCGGPCHVLCSPMTMELVRCLCQPSPRCDGLAISESRWAVSITVPCIASTRCRLLSCMTSRAPYRSSPCRSPLDLWDSSFYSRCALLLLPFHSLYFPLILFQVILHLVLNVALQGMHVVRLSIHRPELGRKI
jgi:hypothetical protein